MFQFDENEPNNAPDLEPSFSFDDTDLNEISEVPDHPVFSLINEPTKAKFKEVAEGIANAVKEHDQSYLESFIKLKSLQETIALAMELIKKDALSDLEDQQALYSSKELSQKGVKITTKKVGDKYDFSNSDSWNSLKHKEEQVKKDKKNYEEKMKTAIKYTELADENGEIIPPAQIIEYGGDTISITFPKA